MVMKILETGTKTEKPSRGWVSMENTKNPETQLTFRQRSAGTRRHRRRKTRGREQFNGGEIRIHGSIMGQIPRSGKGLR
jgi:hypothetical protein